MISIYLKNYKKVNLFGLLFAAFFVVYGIPLAQAESNNASGLSLSVTPTLFEMSAIPSQVWSSGVKVINNNKYEITVYANVVNFAPQGEEGEGKFIPVLEKATEGTTLAEWITYPKESITIAAEQSYTIPLTVALPANAAPGGHFAAILIGTKPPVDDGSMKVSTSQVVTSLFFVRVAGDVVENGIVRDFRVLHPFVSTPMANFEVRFENKGNVHLQPQGEIVITNMWGKERGVIPINHETHFGNVLPKSIRKFEFSWHGEQSFSDIGRYKAVITLAYGAEARKFVTSAVYFYVVPVKAASITLISILAFIFFVRWAIKAYVRKMLTLAGIDPVYKNQSARASFRQEGDVRIQRRASVKAPVASTLADFKTRFKNVTKIQEKVITLGEIIFVYKRMFGAVLLMLVAVVAATVFVRNATKDSRDYEIVIDNAGTAVTLSSEDIIRSRELKATSSLPLPAEALVVPQSYKLILVNSSDLTGAAARLQTQLEQKGYTIASLKSDFEATKDKTVIVYDPQLQEQALDLRKILNAAPLSANPNVNPEELTITVYIGNDFTE